MKIPYDIVDEEEITATIEEKFGNIEERQERFNFSTKLRKLLKDKDIRQYELAEAIGVKKSTICTYTKGNSLPKLEIINKIAEYFKVTTNYLLGKTEETTYTAEQICNLLGIDEKASEHLYSLRHDIEEVKELDEGNKISHKYDEQLTMLSLFIADKRNLPIVLKSMKKYIDMKQQIIQLEKSNDNDFLTNEKIETLEIELVKEKSYIEHFLYKSLDKIANKNESGE